MEENEKRRIAGLDTFELWMPDRDDTSIGGATGGTYSGSSNMPPPPPGAASDEVSVVGNLRQHAWVMVSGGRRDVRETVFLEPSTGRAYGVNSAPYTGVESIWNHENFWVLNSSQMKKKMSELDFDLSLTSVWEDLFPKGAHARPSPVQPPIIPLTSLSPLSQPFYTNNTILSYPSLSLTCR